MYIRLYMIHDSLYQRVEGQRSTLFTEDILL